MNYLIRNIFDGSIKILSKYLNNHVGKLVYLQSKVDTIYLNLHNLCSDGHFLSFTFLWYNIRKQEVDMNSRR